jgi:hypothetical protein
MNPIHALKQAIEQARSSRPRLPHSVRWPVILGALLLAASSASVMATQNTAPEFSGIRQSDRSITEGQTVSLAGIFTDPDQSDTHTLLVYWDGGDSNEKEKVQIPAGQRSFELQHKYPDNFEPQPIKLVIFDHTLPEGTNDNTTGIAHDTEFLPFEVRNVDPRFVQNSITVDKSAKPKVVVEGDFLDPSAADKMQVFATWSDQSAPETTQCSLSNGDRHFRCEHTYPRNYAFGIKRTYTVNLIVKDDEGGWSQQETKVTLP